jgi:hypothetical protein
VGTTYSLQFRLAMRAALLACALAVTAALAPPLNNIGLCGTREQRQACIGAVGRRKAPPEEGRAGCERGACVRWPSTASSLAALRSVETTAALPGAAPPPPHTHTTPCLKCVVYVNVWEFVGRCDGWSGPPCARDGLMCGSLLSGPHPDGHKMQLPTPRVRNKPTQAPPPPPTLCVNRCMPLCACVRACEGPPSPHPPSVQRHRQGVRRLVVFAVHGGAGRGVLPAPHDPRGGPGHA